MAVINGTDQNDVLRGTAGRETINGLAGDDIIHGKGGEDVIHGGAGNDVIRAGFNGQFGGSTLDGGGGHDAIHGGGGGDVFHGGRGDDRLYGGAGVDDFHWRSGDGDDVIDGGEGAGDSVDVDQSFFTLDPSSARTSFLVAGDDALDVAVSDAAGDARLTITNAESFFVSGGEGADTIDFRGYAGHDQGGIVNVEAGGGEDRVFGTMRGDWVSGGAGNDAISLRGGDDVYVLEGGDDRVCLGGGRDTIEIEDGGIGAGRRTVVDFDAAKDRLVFATTDEAKLRDGYLDSNGDGHLGCGDRGVGVEDGAVTIDLGRFAGAAATGLSTLTLPGVTEVDMGAIDAWYVGI